MSAQKLVLTALLGAWLLHVGTALRTSYDRPRLEAQLLLSQRLGLGGLYADGAFEFLRPWLTGLAIAIESDPSRRAVFAGKGAHLESTLSLTPELKRAVAYQRQPAPEQLLELKIIAYQGLSRLGVAALLGLFWTAGCVALATGSDSPPAHKKSQAPPISTGLGLGLFLLWALLTAYGLSPLLRSLLAESGGWSKFWAIQISSGLLFLGLLGLTGLQQWKPFQRPQGRAVGHGVFVCALAILGTELLIWTGTGISPFARNSTLSLLLRASGIDLLGLVAWALVVAPLLEELIFRGWLLSALLTQLSRGPALIATSAVFALAHGSFWNAPGQFAGGLVLGWVALRTGSIGSSVLIHSGWNLFWLIRVLASAP